MAKKNLVEEKTSYIIEDEDLFPIWVSLGFDIYGYSQPLYFTDGITIYPDGSMDTDDDLEDALKEYREERNKEPEQEPDYDFLDDDEDLNFNEIGVFKEIANFSELEEDDCLNITNDINFALIAALDSRPVEHIHEITLFNAAIDAGSFSAKRADAKNYSFSENVRKNIPDDNDIYDALFQDYNEASNITLRALGYQDTNQSMKQSLKTAKAYIDNNSDADPVEIVRMIKLATGLKKQDLAKASVRLSIGRVDYSDLPKASLISHLAFSET